MRAVLLADATEASRAERRSSGLLTHAPEGVAARRPPVCRMTAVAPNTSSRRR